MRLMHLKTSTFRVGGSEIPTWIYRMMSWVHCFPRMNCAFVNKIARQILKVETITLRMPTVAVKREFRLTTICICRMCFIWSGAYESSPSVGTPQFMTLRTIIESNCHLFNSEPEATAWMVNQKLFLQNFHSSYSIWNRKLLFKSIAKGTIRRWGGSGTMWIRFAISNACVCLPTYATRSLYLDSFSFFSFFFLFSSQKLSPPFGNRHPLDYPISHFTCTTHGCCTKINDEKIAHRIFAIPWRDYGETQLGWEGERGMERKNWGRNFFA